MLITVYILLARHKMYTVLKLSYYDNLQAKKLGPSQLNSCSPKCSLLLTNTSLKGMHREGVFLRFYMYESESDIFRCRKQYVGQVISNARLLESCVNAIFAALLWHTQELRDQVADYC